MNPAAFTVKLFLLQQRVELIHAVEDENGFHRGSVPPRMFSVHI